MALILLTRLVWGTYKGSRWEGEALAPGRSKY